MSKKGVFIHKTGNHRCICGIQNENPCSTGAVVNVTIRVCFVLGETLAAQSPSD